MATRTTKTTFSEVNRKRALNGLLQEVILEPTKQYIDLESYSDDLVEDLQPLIYKNFQLKGSWNTILLDCASELLHGTHEDCRL